MKDIGKWMMAINSISMLGVGAKWSATTNNN